VSTVAIVDGGGANIASLLFAIERLGRTGVLTTDPELIRSATRVILPGVGAARAAMERLVASGLDAVIPSLTQPVLGICLGLQLLFESSAEDDVPCLGIVPGRIRRLDAAPNRPVPHMGWNQLSINRRVPLLDGVDDGDHCYFVHSYAADPGAGTMATTDYGRPFTAVLVHRNFQACQFHPERSGPTGARILANFLSD
jgi:imidazole glycerol-phosphate synthase subunit HisH